MAFGFLLLLVGIFVLINTFNGNLPGLVNIPGIHDATTTLRGLGAPTSTTSSIPLTPGSFSGAFAGGNFLNGAIDNVTKNLDSIAVNATKNKPSLQ